jgi:hypothetical protein
VPLRNFTPGRRAAATVWGIEATLEDVLSVARQAVLRAHL